MDRRGWLDARDLKDALAFTKPLPGSTVVQVVTFLGWRLAGWPGALVATAAFLIPATAVMTAAAAATFALPDVPWVRGALTGVQVAVVGLLASALSRLARSEAGAPLLAGVLAVSFVAGLFVNAALLIALAAAIARLRADQLTAPSPRSRACRFRVEPGMPADLAHRRPDRFGPGYAAALTWIRKSEAVARSASACVPSTRDAPSTCSAASPVTPELSPTLDTLAEMSRVPHAAA